MEKNVQIFTRWADSLTIVYFTGYDKKELEKYAQYMGAILFGSETAHVNAERYTLETGITAYLLYGLTKGDMEKIMKVTGCTKTTAVEGLENQNFVPEIHDPEKEKETCKKEAETEVREMPKEDNVPDFVKEAEKNAEAEETKTEEKKSQPQPEAEKRVTFTSLCKEWIKEGADKESIKKEVLDSINKYKGDNRIRAVYAASTTVFRDTSLFIYRKKNGENAEPDNKALADYIRKFLKKNGEKGVEFFLKKESV